ncbi:YbaB/EbfC family nucleoid-associated protein [bacterium]|nr:YbaB/EbfC family nucleoid-associated protein [bacterium]
MSKQLSKMLKEAQKLERKLAEVRDDLAARRVEGTSGGGVVTVTMNGQRDVLGIRIQPEVLKGADPDMLEDLLLSALRDAKERSDALAAAEMAKVTGGVMPGMGM